MAVYYKPQSPIQSGEDFIYPITTADQVILSDGSRLEKNGQISIGGGTVKTVSGVAPDSAGNVALTASDVGAASAESVNQLKDDKLDKTGTAADSSKLGGKTMAQLLLTIYPVGSVYLSLDMTSPASLFGGTWESIGGRFLLGADATYAAGSTGGEATHTLTVSEMPSHGHNVLKEAPGWGESMTLSPWTPYFKNDAFTDAGNSGYTAEFWTYNPLKGTGDGLAHNNMPPYLAVYMWKRVS